MNILLKNNRLKIFINLFSHQYELKYDWWPYNMKNAKFQNDCPRKNALKDPYVFCMCLFCSVWVNFVRGESRFLGWLQLLLPDMLFLNKIKVILAWFQYKYIFWTIAAIFLSFLTDLKFYNVGCFLIIARFNE